MRRGVPEPLAAMKPWSGVIGEDGVEIQRVGVVEVASQAFGQVTPADKHVFEFDWSPDSTKLAYVAANAPERTTGGWRICIRSQSQARA